MSGQLTIDFMHGVENNRESQMHYEANAERFCNQCQLVLAALKRGEKLTTTEALLKYNIGDLRARIRDLRVSYNNVFGLGEVAEPKS